MALGLGPQKPSDPEKPEKPEKPQIPAAAPPPVPPAPKSPPPPPPPTPPAPALPPPPKSDGKRKLTIGFVVSIYIISAVAIWVFIAIVTTRFIPRPLDVTHIRTFSLERETQELLHRVNKPLRITALFTDDIPLRRQILDEIEELVDLLKIESSQIYYQRINPDRDPASTHELITRTKIDSREENYKNGIVLELGDRASLIPFRNFSHVEAVTISRVRSWQEKAFNGEHAIASGILNLLEDQHPNIDFVLGHGEMDTEDSKLDTGLLYAKNALLEEKMRVRQLFLLEKLKIPDDSSVVCVMGPTETFTAPEVMVIEKFLERGGGLFLCADPGRFTGLEMLLAKYGIEIGRNRVIDSSQKKAGGRSTIMLVKSFGDHPIVSPLKTSNIMISNASTVRKAGVNASLSPRLVRTELLWSSDRAWAESDLTNPKVSFNPETGDIKGPVPYAIAAEIPPDSNDPRAAARGGVRLVVAGSNELFTNFAFADIPANGDLFQNIINWLSKRDRLSTARPRSPDNRSFTITEPQAEALLIAAYFGVPGIFALFGFLIAWRRRR
ncbi:MAG: GldG family protein [Planctomycetes bacterium]|nr:GldG family protein [Planctomycetota bacterium]